MYQPANVSLQRVAHQRVDGAARLAYRLDETGRTRLADLFQRAPCRVLFPDVESDDCTQAVLLTTSGGLTGGDRLDLQVETGPGTRLVVSTQAAEKLYRALPGEDPTRIEVRLRAGASAWLEYLAQETILFDRSRLRRLFVADLDAGARLLAVESLVFGRGAMGEDVKRGALHDAWRIRRDGRLVWADALHLAGDDVAAQRAAPYGFGAARACATLVYVGDDARALLAPLRESLAAHAGIAAATAFDGLLVLRVLADEAPAMRAAVRLAVVTLRRLAAGLPARLPRVWDC